jgi:hypothetical protein
VHARRHDLRVGAQRLEERLAVRAEGFTAVIHGKIRHEETQATASQALQFPGGRYLVVFDRDEAAEVCDYIRRGGDRTAFLARFGHAASDGFDPDVDLGHIGWPTRRRCSCRSR